MVKRKPQIRPIPEDVLLKTVHEEAPDVVFLPMTEERLAEIEKTIEELHSQELRYPILKQTDESLKIFEALSEFKRAQDDLINVVEYSPIEAVITPWLSELHSKATRIKYAAYMEDLIRRKAIPETFADGQKFTIGGLRHVDQKSIIQYIESLSDLTDNAKNARIECYISFTCFLERITSGWFRRALPITMKKSSLYRSTIKTSYKALSLEELKKFSSTLEKINQRDQLIALTMFYGVTRISDVLPLTLDKLDFEKNIIRFPQQKNKVLHEKPVSYPALFMKKLNEYITRTTLQRKESSYVFITRKGKMLTRSRINYSFSIASNEAHIRQVSPDTIRATWLALKQSNIKEEELNDIINSNEVNP